MHKGNLALIFNLLLILVCLTIVSRGLIELVINKKYKFRKK